MRNHISTNSAREERAQGTSYLIIVGGILFLAEAVNASAWLWTNFH